MKVHVIGGGPAGLYFSILMKKAWPQTRITVFERNRPDDTFGFGVVFSDQTLDTFESYDRESYRAIIGHFAYWDDIEIHFRGTTHRIGGNGFCGCSRGTLLKILGRRARSLGVEIKYQSEVSPLDPAIRDADLVVVADGINSRIRDAFADRFKPSVDLRPNFFSWMGSTRPFDAFTFFFRETEHGIFIAHCYQYEPQRSTWIIETDPRDIRACRPRPARRGGVRAFRRDLVRGGAAGPPAHHQPLDLAQLPDHPLRAMGRGQHGADRRRQGDGAFLHRLRHQAGDGGRDRALRGIPGHRQQRCGHRARALRVAAARRGGKDPALRRRLAGVVRARQPLLEHGPDALCVRPDDAFEGDHLRQPRAARARVRQRGGSGRGARRPCARLPGRDRKAARPDVPAVPPARPDPGEPHRRVADVPVLGAGRAAERLAPRALRLARHRRRRPDVHRNDRRLEGRAHFARDAPASTRTRTRPPGSASSISCMRNRRRSSACSSGMPAARARPS